MSTSQRSRCRADGCDAGNDANGFFDGPGYAQHLDVHRSDAVIHQDDDSGKIRLGKDRDRQAEYECHPCERETEDNDCHGTGMRLDKLSEAACHGFFSSCT
jgi:hypothetical protein